MLGPLDVTVGGGPAPPALLWRRHLVLLVYLARSPRCTRTREHLIGLLWPEKPEKDGRRSLSVALNILRRCGGAQVLSTSGEHVTLHPATLDLDVDRFDRAAAVQDWDAASALMQGTFLEGFGVPGASGVEDWLQAERQQWSRRGVEALLRQAERLRDAGAIAASADLAQRAVSLDQYSNAAIRALMLTDALAGRRAEALRTLELFTKRLATELGTTPDAETLNLARRIRDGRVWKPIPPEDAAVERSRRAPLVGRERQLQQLLRAWQQCRTGGRSAIALILGDAGTGRSRLAEELAERARLDGAAVILARAVEADAAEPGNGLLALAGGGLLDVPGIAAAPASALGALAARLPGWAERFPAAPAVDTRDVARALNDIALAALGEQPLVLAIDDAQWLDRMSLLAFRALARSLAAQPCLILLTAPTFPPRAELDDLRSRIGRDVRGVTVKLGPLTRDDLLALARWALPRYDAVQLDRVVRRVAMDSAGLPLLVVELLHAIALGYPMDGATSAWPAPLRTLHQTLPGDLPEAIVGAARVAYQRLPADARLTLSAAAVLGGRVTVDTLGRATALAPDALTAALETLEWQRWLAAEARGYIFVARVMADVVASDLTSKTLRQRIRSSTTNL